MAFQEHPAEPSRKPEQPLYHAVFPVFSTTAVTVTSSTFFLFGLCSYGKRRIGKAESKRIQYFLFCKGLKIAVSDVDVLFVLIADQITKAALWTDSLQYFPRWYPSAYHKG